MPCVARCETMRWISALAPTSMPRVGWSRISTRGAGISHLASSTFCWLPPESVLVELLDPGRDHAHPPGEVLGELRLGPAIDHAEPAGQPAQHRQRLVGPDRELEHEPLVVAVLGQQRDAELQRVPRRARANRAAVDADLAAVGPGDAEQHLRDLRAAGADQTEEAQDLARAQLEAHVLDEAGPGQPAHAHDRRADHRRLLGEERGEVGADHVPDRLLRASAPRPGR